MVLFIYFGILLIPGLLLSLSMFNTLSMWKEAKHLGTCTCLVSINVMVGVAIFNGLRGVPSASFIVLSTTICVSMLVILATIYGPLVSYVVSQRKALSRGRQGTAKGGMVEANVELGTEDDALDDL